MTSLCPRCGTNLSSQTFGSLQLDGCVSCGGVWFDYLELQTLTRVAGASLMDVERAINPAVSSPDSAGGNRCPKCETPLYGFSFPHTPNVRLDACPDCKGIWVDDGKLQAIAARIAASRPISTEPVASAYDERAREKARYAVAFLLSTPCPHCAIHNPVSAVTCWQCAHPLRTRKAFQLCPRCDIPLQEVQAESGPVRVDACLKCSGVWFSEGELPALLRLGPEEVGRFQRTIMMSTTTSTSQRGPMRNNSMARCPGCHHGMEREQLGVNSGVDIDLCPHCQGVWIDGGELMQAYKFASTGGDLRISVTTDPWASATD